MAKRLCSDATLYPIDSFQMYQRSRLEVMLQSSDYHSLRVPAFDLDAYLQNDYSLLVRYRSGSYIIPVERKPCNFGGCYYFFRCPCCSKRVRKLYCIDGVYQCRSCGDLGYYSQLLPKWRRGLRNIFAIERQLKEQGGSLYRKPPHMQYNTYQRMQLRHTEYEMQYFHDAMHRYISWRTNCECRHHLVSPRRYLYEWEANHR